MGKQNEKLKNVLVAGSINKIAAVLILAVVLASLFLLVSCKSAEAGAADSIDNSSISSSENVSVSGETQTITVTASGGYFPEELNAKAGIESVLIIKSDNAYGCERAFRIPALGVNETLPINGTTEIDLGSQEKGTRLLGTCSMGMYTFEIIFN